MGKSKKKPAVNPDPPEMLNQWQHIFAWNKYDELIKGADTAIMAQFKQAALHLRFILWASTLIHGIFFVMAALALLYGLILSSSLQTRWFGFMLIVTGLIVISVILFRNPLQEIRHTITDITKTQIVLLGYVRQINQIDIAFKQALLSGAIDTDILDKTLEQIQGAVEYNIETLAQSLEEI